MPTRRAAALAVGLGALVPAVTASPAVASTAGHGTLSSSAWFWQRTATQAGLPTDPLAGTEPSNVPDGDLAVAVDAQGDVTKETYVDLDLSAVPAGATVTKLVLTLPLDAAAQQLGSSDQPLAACRPRSSWPSGAGNAWSAKPKDDCSGAPAGKHDATSSTYTFDLTALAPTLLVDDGRGVAIAPRPTGPQAPYQIDFAAPAKAGVAVTWTLPTGSVTTTGSGTTVTGSTGTVSSGTSTGTVTPTVVGAPPVATGVTLPSSTTTSTLGGGQQPQVASTPGAASTRTQEGRVTTAALRLPAAGGLTGGFVLALLGGAAAVLALAALLAERTPEPALVLARRRAVAARLGRS